METSLLIVCGAAFVGGVILNIMPCVLPVLTMKVFHMVGQRGASVTEHRRHGVAYTLGVMLAFSVFAVMVIAMRVSGQAMGWGMQFQNPTFIAGVTALMVALGLNALGVFELSVSLAGGPSGDGLGASFGNGVVAALMATPCSAPFLGTAAAFALGSSAVWWQTLLVFEIIALGLAAPFLAISFLPRHAAALPRPGEWMNTFKKLMGFTLLGAAVWLFGVLQKQVALDSSHTFLVFLLALSIGLWAIGHFGGPAKSAKSRMGVRIAVVLTLSMLVSQTLDLRPRQRNATASVARPFAAEAAAVDCSPAVVDERINWVDFNSSRVALAAAQGRPVFMDYTADWCLNCKTNEKLVLETDAVRSALVRAAVLPMKADWTNEDEEIGRWLDKLGRSGIPAYVIYNPDGDFDLLPEVVTKALVVERLDRAGQRFPPSARLGTPEACKG